MPVRTFDFCALQFLNQWLEKEAEYCQFLASEKTECRLKGLKDASGHFRIARNLPTKFEENGPRFEAVLKALDAVDNVTPDDVVDIVVKSMAFISEAYGKRNVLSATTKFLWLKIKSPIRIYDSQARKALGTNENDYKKFNQAFVARYDAVESQITLACSNLINVRPYTVQPDITEEALNDLVTTTWFRERVLDMYLWNEGND